MAYPQFLQAAQGILQENMVRVRFSSGTAFSFPVMVRRNGALYDAMFCYDTPSEGRSMTARRPHGWVLLSCETGEIKLNASCDVLDFTDTESFPIDTRVEMRLPQPISAQEHSRCYRLIFEEYEKLRGFAFAKEPSAEQRASMRGFCDMFRSIAYVGHYPYYHALAPEFFDWLGLELAPERDKPPARGGTLSRQVLLDELALMAEELRSYIDTAMREQRLLAQRGERVSPEEWRKFAEEVRERFASDTHRDSIIDRLHAEVQEYKNDLLDELTLSMERDIIKVMDDIRKGAEAFREKNFTKENYRRVYNLLQGVEQDLQDLLYRHGVESYEVPGDSVDVQRQRITTTVPTDDPALDKKLAARIAPGWEKQNGIVRPERISVYVLERGE